MRPKKHYNRGRSWRKLHGKVKLYVRIDNGVTTEEVYDNVMVALGCLVNRALYTDRGIEVLKIFYEGTNWKELEGRVQLHYEITNPKSKGTGLMIGEFDNFWATFNSMLTRARYTEIDENTKLPKMGIHISDVYYKGI